EEALLAVPVDGDHAVALGQPLAVGAKDVRQVGEHREPVRGYAHRTVDRDLPRGGRQQVLAAHHVGELHEHVVDRDRQRGERPAVASTKSGTCAWSKVTSPRTRSVNVVEPSGMRNRTTGLRPSASYSATCSAVRIRQWAS